MFDRKSYMQKYMKEYNQRPDVKEKRKILNREYMRGYNKRTMVVETTAGAIYPR